MNFINFITFRVKKKPKEKLFNLLSSSQKVSIEFNQRNVYNLK